MNDLPAQVAAGLEAAIAAYRTGAMADAARGFAAVLEAAPDHPDALRLHGLSLVRAGDAAGGLPALARPRRGRAASRLRPGAGQCRGLDQFRRAADRARP